MNFSIPIYKPDLSGKEREYMIECLESTWISSKGKFIGEFEKGFAAYVGVDNAVAVCNGTVALHLALITLGIGSGDEVIVPTFTYIAAVNAITYVGAIPVFCDSNPDTWQMEPDDLQQRITPKTKAILSVHLYGHPCNMDALIEIARSNNLYLVEDCAEAIGARYKNRHVGTFGHIATFSFFGNKTITTGEGGMVLTNDTTLADRARHFKGQGLALHREYWHDVIGYNYRMTNVCAAIGLAQLERIEGLVEKKQQVAAYYRENLSGLPLQFHQASPDVFHSYWMCSVLVENPRDRDRLRDFLKDAGIETRPAFFPVHTMPMYAKNYSPFRVAEDLGWRGINLPSFPQLTRDELSYIVGAIHRFYSKNGVGSYTG